MLGLSAAVPPLCADDFDLRDLQHEIMVREALAKDARLRPLNLVVRVTDRVATLSGPVPSRELARRAVDTATKVPELREVRDKMLVQFEDTGLILPLALPLTTPTVTPPGLVRPPPAPAAPSIPEPKKTQNATAAVWLPVNPEPPKRPLLGVALLPAITTTQPGVTEAVSRPRDQASAKPATLPDAASISSAVQNLIQGGERYRRLRFEVKQDKVFLSGVVYRWADLEVIAKAVTRIPGVESVVLSEVKTDPPRP